MTDPHDRAVIRLPSLLVGERSHWREQTVTLTPRRPAATSAAVLTLAVSSQAALLAAAAQKKEA